MTTNMNMNVNKHATIGRFLRSHRAGIRALAVVTAAAVALLSGCAVPPPSGKQLSWGGQAVAGAADRTRVPSNPLEAYEWWANKELEMLRSITASARKAGQGVIIERRTLRVALPNTLGQIQQRDVSMAYNVLVGIDESALSLRTSETTAMLKAFADYVEARNGHEPCALTLRASTKAQADWGRSVLISAAPRMGVKVLMVDPGEEGVAWMGSGPAYRTITTNVGY